MTDHVSERDDTLVVSLSGDVDLERSGSVRTLLLDCLQRGKNVLVDLAQVAYIDSSGIANLVEALQTARDRNTGFGLVAPSEQVLRVLQLARLDQVFTIHADLDGATAES